MDIFTRFAPFIQDYIYEHNWKNLRSIQVGAAETIFNSQDNVLLAENFQKLVIGTCMLLLSNLILLLLKKC